MAIKRTSIHIDSDLWKKFKYLALDIDTSTSKLLERVITNILRNREERLNPKPKEKT